MKLTEKMVFELNSELSIMGCPFRYAYSEGTVPSMEIQLSNTNYIKCYTIYPSDNFKEWLYKWFRFKFGIELKCNNTGNILWSKNVNEEKKSANDILL